MPTAGRSFFLAFKHEHSIWQYVSADGVLRKSLCLQGRCIWLKCNKA